MDHDGSGHALWNVDKPQWADLSVAAPYTRELKATIIDIQQWRHRKLDRPRAFHLTKMEQRILRSGLDQGVAVLSRVEQRRHRRHAPLTERADDLQPLLRPARALHTRQ